MIFLLCILPFGIGLIFVRGLRRRSLSKRGIEIDSLPSLKTYVDIVNTLRRKGDDKVDALIALLNSPFYPIHDAIVDPSVPYTDPPTFSMMLVHNITLRAIVAMGSPAVERLTVALHHPNQNVRLGAIKALGRIGDPSAIVPLMAVIRTKTRFERREAVFALLKINHEDSFEPIISFLHDSSVSVREAAVYALEKIGDPRALPELEIVAQTDKALVDRFEPSIGELASKAIKKIRKRTRRS
jgi:HEAT repeat protein